MNIKQQAVIPFRIPQILPAIILLLSVCSTEADDCSNVLFDSAEDAVYEQ